MIRNRQFDWKVAIAFAVLGLALYWSGLRAPWYFDDFRNIVDNPLVRDLGQAGRGILAPRGVAFFSFALSHSVSGLSPTAFRLFNILVHIASALLVWKILARIYRDSSLLPLAGGLLFLVHPLQTQAVTYIVQRMASLAAGCFLLATYLYLRAREAQGAGKSRASLVWGSGSLVAAILAMWTKQNTVVLPLVLLALDRYVIDRERFRLTASAKRIAPFLALAAIAGVQLLWGHLDFIDRLSSQAGVYTERLTGNAGAAVGAGPGMPLRYFATELIVFWVYIKLLVFPVGQALDYSWPVVTHVFNFKTLCAVGGFALVLAAILRWRLWSDRLAFGLAWIVLTLAVESSFLPLDPVYEHRLYLPMLGVAVVLSELFWKRLAPRFQAPVVAAVLIVLAALTIGRNALWADPVAFWSDNLTKTPSSSRVMTNLAKAYHEKNDFAAEEAILRRALALTPGDPVVLAGLGTAVLQQGRPTEARSLLAAALAADADNAPANSYLGSLYLAGGDVAGGLPLLKKAVELRPLNTTYIQNLAVGLELAGDVTEAEAAYRKWQEQDPENPLALMGLGILLDKTGRSREGFASLAAALNKAPNDARICFYFGLVALHAGESGAYRKALARLQQLDPNAYIRLNQAADRSRP